LQLVQRWPFGPLQMPQMPQMPSRNSRETSALATLLKAVEAGEKQLTGWPMISTAMALLVLVFLAALMTGPS